MGVQATEGPYDHQIRTLRAAGWSWRLIGWELGYSREWARQMGKRLGIV